ncbi:hypothetical protein HAX54_031730 [Datura stramonium]|uniref:Uncharacterized protein n=1 Tax=Datura stramonium TaxID=4076 RepID=A0ABS8SC59_DATST|nr:hypothetical protein [Datura stramonium]
MAQLEVVQVEELFLGLKRYNDKFLWVVNESEQTKLPRDFKEGLSNKGLIVSWCPQLEFLAHKAIGCFVTHCGWNSTLEALSLGVPMVALPQWSDQSTNAKYIMDFWRIGVKALADEIRIVRWKVIEGCIKEVMQGERREEIKRNTLKWRELAIEAVAKGGSSDRNIVDFISSFE